MSPQSNIGGDERALFSCIPSHTYTPAACAFTPAAPVNLEPAARRGGGLDSDAVRAVKRAAGSSTSRVPRAAEGEGRATAAAPVARGARSLPFGGGAVNKAKRFCKRGHAFSAANTYVNPEGGRTCRTCIRALKAGYRQAWRDYLAQRRGKQ